MIKIICFSGEQFPIHIHKLLRWKLSNITPVVVRKVVANSGYRLLKSKLKVRLVDLDWVTMADANTHVHFAYNEATKRVFEIYHIFIFKSVTWDKILMIVCSSSFVEIKVSCNLLSHRTEIWILIFLHWNLFFDNL